MNRLLPLAAGICLAVACSGSSPTTTADDPSGGAATDNGKAANSEAANNASPRKLVFESATPNHVTLLDFIGGDVVVGFGDGRVTKLRAGEGVKFDGKVAKKDPIGAVSPSGNLALLATAPPVIVNMQGDLIVQMNTVPEFESATFSSEGLGIYVADKTGKVRIWGQAHTFEEENAKEKLEDYLNRQAPDFLIEFPSVRGPVHMTDDNKLVITDAEGIVRLWDQMSPSSSKRLMKLDAAAQSIDSAGGYIFVTSTFGQLKVAKADGSGYMPWSKDVRGRYVAATPLAVDQFFVLDEGRMELIDVETGEPKWKAELPKGRPCGLAVSPDASRLAACVGNYVAVFDATNGNPIGYGYATSDGFQWKQ